jgi:WD40 repeat protein
MIYTGGKDELVRVYSLKDKRSEGAVPGQSGTITKLLESEKYLFSAGSDGRVIISKNQQLYESLLCHTSQILDFDLHHSGRMMVTIALDKKIKLWNLMNMKEEYHKNIKKNVDFVRFAPDNNLLLSMMENIAIFDTASNSIGGVIEHNAKVTEIVVDVKKELLITGDDEGRIYIRKYQTEGPMSTITFQAFDKRVKQMKLLQGYDRSILVAISTEGYICVYDIEDILDNLESLEGKLMDIGQDFDPIYNFEIASRLISMGARLNFLRKPVDEEDEATGVTKKI